MKHAQISVTAGGPGRYRVDGAGPATTSHEVTIPDGYLEALGIPAVPPEAAIEESFRFLLEREPNTSILRTFSLPVIESYFPEYRSELGRRLRT